MARAKLIIVAVALLASQLLRAQNAPVFSSDEIGALATHRLTRALPADPSNAAMGKPAAILFGQRLFFDARLAAAGAMSCATCHVPADNYSSRKPRLTSDTTTRKVPSLYNVAFNRWFTWDGHVDSLWMQVLAVFANSREFGATPLTTSHLIRGDAALRTQFTAVFGSQLLEEAASSSANIANSAARRIEVDVAKAIAAYVATLTTTDAPFDSFVDWLRAGARGSAPISLAAQRGAKIFLGKGQCGLCHRGAFFTDGEFHNAGLISSSGAAETGRAIGAESLLQNPYNLLGEFSDSKDPRTADKTRYLHGATPQPGAFKTPGLRNVAAAGPYMHDGRLATLQEVLRHYVTIGQAANADAAIEPMLRLVSISDEDAADLLAFLQSLSAPPVSR